MKKHIATFCCLLVIQSSVAIAGETGNTVPQSSATVTPDESSAGPLRRASLSKTPWTLRSEPASNHRQDQDPAASAAPDPDTRSWAARHPVWTGAMVGFAAGSLLLEFESSSSPAACVDSSADLDVSVPVDGLAQAASMRASAERTYAKFFIGEPPARLSAARSRNGSGS